MEDERQKARLGISHHRPGRQGGLALDARADVGRYYRHHAHTRVITIINALEQSPPLALAVTRGSRSESAVALSTLGSHTIVRLNSFMLTFVPIAFGLGFAVFGIGAFIRTGNFQEQFEGKFQSIRAGKIQPEALTADRKYVDHGGKGVWPHVVFSSNRQPKVDIAVTIDFFQ
jgi:hypothetical protein